MPPAETPRDPVEIRQDAAISIQEALNIADEQLFPIGKSTLQRWAKVWAELRAESPVKSVLVTTRKGNVYHLDREDFKAWIFVQKQNVRPGETLRDPMISHETPQDIARPQQTSRDTERPRETSSEEMNTDAQQKLRDENMQLKIDVEVRKQLLNQAAGEITRQRNQIEGLHRENGALQSQLLQLSAPAKQDRLDLPPAADHVHEPEIIHYPQDSIDNSASAAGGAL